jgi:hypothetical protein
VAVRSATSSSARGTCCAASSVSWWSTRDRACVSARSRCCAARATES